MLALAVTVQKVWSADFWWQLRNGQWIVEHGAVPRAEMFSHTAAGTPVREMRWLYCIAIWEVWSHAGAWLLVLVQAGMTLLAWGLVVWRSRGALRTPLGVLVVGLGLAAGFNRWVMRPELVTYVMTAAFLVVLERGLRERRWRGVWMLPLLQVVWVNTHTLFLFGVALAWVGAGAAVGGWVWGKLLKTKLPKGQSGEEGGGERVQWRFVVVALLVTAACWVNPYGHAGAMYVVQLYREASAANATARDVMEMRSPFAMPLWAWGADLWCGLVLVVMTGVALGWVWWKATARRAVAPGAVASGDVAAVLARAAVWVMGAYLFVTLQRNVGLAAIMCAWAGLASLRRECVEAAGTAAPRAAVEEVAPSAAADGGTSLLGEGARQWHVLANVVIGVVFACAGWYVATDRYSVRMGLPREFGLGVVEWYQPRGAAAYIAKQRPPRELFNVIRDGSYFISAVSDVMPVFIDGRTDAYGPSLIDAAAGVSGRSWDEFVAKWKIGTAVIPNRGYDDLIEVMRDSPKWRLAEMDETSLVFVRWGADPEWVRALRREDHVLSEAEAAEADGPPAWKRMYGGVGRAAYSMGMAESYLALREDAKARAYLEAAVSRSPGLSRARAALAPMLIAEGRAVEGEALALGLSAPQRAGVDREVARLLVRAGELVDAIPYAERALEHDPSDDGLRVVLADLYFQTRRLALARREYERVVERVMTTNEWNKLGTVCEMMNDLPGAARAYRRSLDLDDHQIIVGRKLRAINERLEAGGR